MRIRTVKPEFFKHEALFDAETESGLPCRLAFAGLWCAADREGRFKWRPRQLKADILPFDDVDFSRVLDALSTRGFIVKYHVKEEWFGVIPSFGKHQVVNNRERSSELPEVPEIEDIPRVHHASTTRGQSGKAEGKGREGKGIEVHTSENSGIETRIQTIHCWYSEMRGGDPPLDEFSKRLWFEWFALGNHEDDFKRVFKMKNERVMNGDHEASLHLRNLLAPDRFPDALSDAKRATVSPRRTGPPQNII